MSLSVFHQALFAVWSDDAALPDIFILAGWGDGFGPGDTSPTHEELQEGNYGSLQRVPFVL